MSSSQAPRESFPPDTAISTRSPGRIMSKAWMARRTCSWQWWTKQSAQKAALWRRRSISAGALQRRHFIGPPLTARDHGADLDRVGLLQSLVVGDERVVADHEHGLGVD